MGDAALVLCPTEGVLHPPALPGACVSPGLRPHKLTGVSGSRGWRQLPMGCVDQVSEMGRRNPLTANTRGFLLLPMGVLLEETSVIHPPVTLSNNPFTSPKNPWHQWVLSHQPHNHQVPRSHHSQLTWLSNPALDTHQSHDDYVLCYRYISPQNMNMLKHPIMFWHACKEKKKEEKKAHGNKDDSLPMAAAARTHKIKLYSSEKGYYYGVCFPSPITLTHSSQNKGGNINTYQT